MKDELPAGTIIGNDYLVLETLGRGGFGITYKCEDIRLKLVTAVKEYFPEGMADRDPSSLDVLAKNRSKDTYAWGLKKFLVEGTTLAAIQHKYSNEYIVKIIRFVEERKTAYLAMEFIDGVPIDTFAFSNRITSAKQVEELFRSLCIKALKPIHDANFYHRDIKPDNILVRHSNNEPVIIDFGAAKQTAGGKNTVALLTPRYSAVEQYASQEDIEDDGDHDLCGSFTDIYSLAATFYFIIKGKPPQDAPSRLISDNADKLLGDSSLSHYSDEFLSQIDWGMEPIPKNRPQTADEWLQQSGAQRKSVAAQSDTDVIKTRVENSITGIFEQTSSMQLALIAFGVGLCFFLAVNVYNGQTLEKEALPKPQSEVKIQIPEKRENISAPTAEVKVLTESWVVGIDAVGWTSINVFPKLKAIQEQPLGSYQLKLHGDEPFRVKTEKGLAMTKATADSFGGISGEVYLKSVNGSPQKVQVEIIQID